MNDEQILKSLGIASLTAMQEAAVRSIAAGRSVVLLSPTGSGKTVAFLLPMAGRLDAGKATLQCVVVLPVRELAQQCEQVFRQMKTSLRSLCLYGGRTAMEEHRLLKEIRPQIVFATPGRLNDHFDKDNLFGGTVTALVIDEFDKCAELGFEEDMRHIVRRLPCIRQLVLTSATQADKIPGFLADVNLPAKQVDMLDFRTAGAALEERVCVRVVASPEKDKLATAARLLACLNGELAIVFVGYRESVVRVGKYLRSAGFVAEMYHGGMEQDRRERNLYRFRAGSANVLVATDLAARGLDIPEVQHIVHYHLPKQEDGFVHRTGRTARWDKTGATYLLLGPDETLPEFVGSAEALELPAEQPRPVPPRFTAVYIGRGKRDKLSKADIVGFFCKRGGLRAEDIGRIDIAAHRSYVSVVTGKAGEALRRAAGEKIKGMKTLIEEMRD